VADDGSSVSDGSVSLRVKLNSRRRRRSLRRRKRTLAN